MSYFHRVARFFFSACILSLPWVFSFSVLQANAEIGKLASKLQAPLTTKWDQLEIPVCWENPTAQDAQGRHWVEQAVQETWELHSLVDFVGWNECLPNSRGIRIVIEDPVQNLSKKTDNGPHVKKLGKDLDGLRNGMSLNFTFNNWSNICRNNLQPCIKAIAVHEFGHALGFAHEQNRLDAPIECRAEKQGGDGDTYLTYYDLTSIMNYCNPNWNGNGKLSSSDITGLQKWYGWPAPVQIQSFSGLCLDVDLGTQNNAGAEVQVWGCWGSENQKWYHKTPWAEIRSHAGLCLNIDRDTQYKNGAKVQVWGCWGGENQKWRFENGHIFSQAGKCLEVDRGTQHQNGANVQVWECWGGENQRWRIDDGRIISNAGLCLGVDRRERKKNGAKLKVWHCTGDDNQNWVRAEPKGQIISEAGLCLDVDRGNQFNSGAKVQVWGCWGSENQEWKAEVLPFPSGPFSDPNFGTWTEIVSNAGLCLDIDRGTQYQNGAKVQVWGCWGGENQKWRVENGRIVSDTGLCLDVDRSIQYNSGAEVRVFGCWGGENQKWDVGLR